MTLEVVSQQATIGSENPDHDLQTPDSYNEESPSRVDTRNKHYASLFIERCIKKIEDEATDCNL